MKRRLYLMAPNIECAKKVVDEILLARIDERHIHVIAKEGIPLDDLPEASLFQRSDLAHAVERGLGLGGAAGLLAGLVAVSVPAAGLILAGGATVLVTTIAGATVGAWSASLLALNVPNSKLRVFQGDLEASHILIIVDVPKEKMEGLRSLIHRTHVDIHDAGMDKTVPHFP